MKSFSQYKIPALALAFYFILYVLFYDSLQYLLDSDAVAYLTIAHRAAEGDWLKSINGLWSPLNSWLLVPFIKSGVDSWTAAKGLNAFFGGVLILQFWALLNQLNFSKFKVALATFSLVLPICFFVYFQMFGDVLQLIFALGYISLSLRKDFIENAKWVLVGALLMGIGYYAKAYSLVFFILHFSVLAFLPFRKEGRNVGIIIRNYVLGIGVILLIALPWAFQLQKKYGEFAMTGMAGKLNMSWYINSSKTFNDSIQLLVPPAYDDAPTFWEDPYLSAGELSTPLTSGHHFKRWVLRVGHTCLMALKCVSQISVFFIPIFLLFLFRLLKRRKVSDIQKKIIWATILLPLGYLAMHIETRYVWLLMFLIAVLGLYVVEGLDITTKMKQLFMAIFCLSLVVYPFYMLQGLKGKNENLFILAEEFKRNDISGKVVSNMNDEGSFWVVSYLAGLNNYTIEHPNYSLQELITEMRRYHVQYYYHIPQEGGDFSSDQKEFNEAFQNVFNSKQAKSVLYELRD